MQLTDQNKNHTATGCLCGEKLKNFQELLRCIFPIHFTTIDAITLRTCSSTSDSPEIISSFLALEQINPLREQIVEASELINPEITPLEKPDQNLPFSCSFPYFSTNSIGMVWCSDLEQSPENGALIHVMGPVFVNDFSIAQVENRLNNLHLSLKLKRHFLSVIRELPLLPLHQFRQHAILLHYCLTGELLSMDQLLLRTSDTPSIGEFLPEPSGVGESRHGSDYMLEQQLLSCVREGNLSYQDSIKKLSDYSTPPALAEHDQLRSVKNLLITFTTLCTRAAIEGGMTPDSAYTFSDYYINQIESCDDLLMMSSIRQSMLDHFVREVHRLKTSPLSPSIQQLCIQIQLHPERPVNIHEQAQQLGYSDYYLTKKFKKETGTSIIDYINRQKMEKAKQLLVGSQLSIGQIAYELNICSQSYFGKLFQKYTGMSPLEYRNRSGA